MNVFLTGNYHPKNWQSLLYSIKFLDWKIVPDIEKADIIFSGTRYIDITNYPDKKFVFGPHFSVFPEAVVRKFNNKYKNAIYIQPSQQSVDTWVKEFKFDNLPMYSYAFGVDTERFKPSRKANDKNQVFIYHKNRDPSEFQCVISFLNKRGYKPVIFDYANRYKEETYLRTLQNSKWGFWVGSHESQGYALQESLSTDVPLIVWNVKLRKQEYASRYVYQHIKSQVTTIPYWDDICGSFFYEHKDMEQCFDNFISNIENYRPRDFVLENLSMDKRTHALKDMILNNRMEANE